jgi:hypothetical protein
MNPPIDHKKAKLVTNFEKVTQIYDNKYFYYYIFDIKYELLAPIIKDVQKISQLIKFIKNNQLSDLILIYGKNSYSIDSRFYFNYRNIIDFYVKVTEFIEADNFIKIIYYIYKTGPISKKFFVSLSLFNNDEGKFSKLEIELILPKENIINQKILNIIYGELNFNYLYLTQAIKNQKNNSFFYNSSIIKNEFHTLCQIMQNVKLIEYMINGKLQKINVESKENDCNFLDYNKYIHLNDIFAINFKKKKVVEDWLCLNNISFQIKFLKTKEDRMTIQYKILLNDQEINDNPTNNIILIHVRKLTDNSCFVLIKSSWDIDIPKNAVIEIKQIFEKSLNKIEKLCQIAKDKYKF